MLITILIFIVILGLLVFVHELGHFIVAKRSGMKVDEFGFGFPPRVFGIQKIEGRLRLVWGTKQSVKSDTTIYSINAIPLGGFVRIVGENNDAPDNPESFTNKPFFPRLLTLVAGVLMNVLLAWLLVSVGFIHGLPVAIDAGQQFEHGGTFSGGQVAIVEVQPNSPASEANLRPGDVIVQLGTDKVETIDQVQSYIGSHKGQPVTFQLKRGSNIETVQVTPLASPPAGSGPTGIALSSVGLLSYPWYWAPIEAARTVISQLVGIVTGLYSVIVSGHGFESLGGPAKIAQLTGEVADLGFIYLLQFTAFLSLNLAILNILPFPALDGGRVLFLLIEKVRGRKNNQTIEQIANTAGFLLLLLLMVAVTVNDIRGFGGVGNIVKKLFGG